MADTVAQFRSNLSPTNNGCISPGCTVSATDHVTGSDVMSEGQVSPVLTPRGGSSGSASLSSCSSHETVVSVGLRQPETRDHPRDTSSPTTECDKMLEPETVRCNGDPMPESGDEVFQAEMSVMSPLVNRWRRKQQAEAEINSTSGPYLGWSRGKSAGFGLRSNLGMTEANGEGRRGRSTHGYSSDTDAFLRTLNRRETTSGKSLTVSGRSGGQPPSTEYPTWHQDWNADVHRIGSSSSAVKQEVYYNFS